MSTEIDKLKHYMYPFYQASSDTAVLEWWVGEYTYADVAASQLWANIPFEYDIKKFKTGAEETTYADFSALNALCSANVKKYEKMAIDRSGNGSFIALVNQVTIAGGATK